MIDLPPAPYHTPALPPRTPWCAGFPDVVVHTALAARDAHPHYMAAKAGDAEAALMLSQDLLNRGVVADLWELVGARGAILLPITALEVAGFNAIPDAMAQLLAEDLGWSVSAGDIVQNNKVGHTRARAFNRLVTPAAFEGPVIQGGNYVLVDDHVGLGGTLTNLKGYVETHGGEGSGDDHPYRKPRGAPHCATARCPHHAIRAAWRRARKSLAGTVRPWRRLSHQRRRRDPSS